MGLPCSMLSLQTHIQSMDKVAYVICVRFEVLMTVNVEVTVFRV
jgi:hypothetical protein